MAITPASITRSSVVSGLNSGSTTCATCGKATSVTNKAYSGGYSGRDSYVCATCGKNGSTSSGTASSGSTYGRTATTTSSYCPNCNKTHAATTHWTGGSSSSSSTGKGVTNSVSWAR